ncbi:glycosyltransferase [Labrys monachus]|uniref:Glycosyltransferase 2-like domain-containing protein n=1 Tax=Labrys monachus TaxID=217067 RepID=A0ABU0FFT5_9HYPH|nr:glycosyltransferase [Labrys monachus]MDQ0392973.1 hypothetical protein [Labrys monachus]
MAIPACDEAERIEACLAALAGQRDRCGAPLAETLFEILVFANNCSDGTAERVAVLAEGMPQTVSVVTETLSPDHSNAGWARKRAMDLAAARLIERRCFDGVILTTDADSCVAPTWVAASLRAVGDGADCVAGYVDGHPSELLRLGPAFLRRGRLEDRYLAAVAEIYARCDPRPHDPWPNHRVSSGASLAVTLCAYQAIGGLPPVPVGEDGALAHALECAGFKVRHAMDVTVTTSCRLDGRAKGGAADTMSLRHIAPDAPCDEDIEPAFHVARRALYKGYLRRLFEGTQLAHGQWAGRLGLTDPQAAALAELCNRRGFEEFWRELAKASPVLGERIALRPSDLPRQIERAGMLLRHLRRVPADVSRTAAPDDMFPLSGWFEPEAA